MKNTKNIMKFVHTTYPIAVIAAIGLLGVSAPAGAAIIQTNVSSTTELLYAGDVSGADLLQGLTGVDSGTAWKLPSSRVNNGTHGPLCQYS